MMRRLSIGRSRRLWGVLLAVALASLATDSGPARSQTPEAPGPPNFIIVLTDDQATDSLPHQPAVMPYLQSRIDDTNDPWVYFPNAFLNTPLCCPARASILTGRYSDHTGVINNGTGNRLNESATVATWLDSLGYHTGLIGKYLNAYPFRRGDYVPPGWDHWAALTPPGADYYYYTLNEGGTPVTYGFRGNRSPADYQTDVLAAKARAFIENAPADQPFMLFFAPAAPHYPYQVAQRHGGKLRSLPPTVTPNFNEADVSDKPAWVQALPLLTPTWETSIHQTRRKSYEMLLAVDEAVSSLVDTTAAKGVLDNTVIIYLTDNGFAFGEHRWREKRCPYDVCTRTPFLVRYPGATGVSDPHLVSNVDIAPTLMDLAGGTASIPQDGLSLVPLLEGSSPGSWRTDVLLSWLGDGSRVPPYHGIRSEEFLYTELSTGEKELYDLLGVLSPADPWQLVNRAGDPGYAAVEVDLAARLDALRP